MWSRNANLGKSASGRLSAFRRGPLAAGGSRSSSVSCLCSVVTHGGYRWWLQVVVARRVTGLYSTSPTSR